MANIVHFGKYYWPDTGGIESVTASLAKGAVKAGHDVSVVCFKKTDGHNKEIIDGVKITRAPIAKLLASQPLGFKYVLQCISAAKKADLVHLHTPNMLGALCALFVPANKHLLVHWHSDVLNKGLLGKILRPLEMKLLHRANSIVTTSQVYADASKTLTPFKSKISVVPIGVPDARRDSKESDLPLELKTKIGNKKIILAVGRLVAYKGFEILINAAQLLANNSIVIIVGGGPLQNELHRAIQQRGVEDRVLLTGRLDDYALHRLFKKASLYCLPSTYRAEAFGVVLLEAMAHGVPIVASNIPGSGVPWVNQHGQTGLNVPVGDPKELATACNKILASEELRNKLSVGARRRFLSEFTEDVSVNRMIAIYKKLIDT
ncbi:MAG: glycosyltransferase [Flavobacteriales bacterium]|jgi:glycosyltransferase involved in cell wall biosynthesis